MKGVSGCALSLTQCGFAQSSLSQTTLPEASSTKKQLPW
jgi:hypothetical protein